MKLSPLWFQCAPDLMAFSLPARNIVSVCHHQMVELDSQNVRKRISVTLLEQIYKVLSIDFVIVQLDAIVDCLQVVGNEFVHI